MQKAMSVNGGEAKETGVNDGIEEGGNGELGELFFEIARDFEEVRGMKSPSGERRGECKEVGT